MPYAVDLFCGAGGFSEGILQEGFDITFSSNRSDMVKATYVNRHEQLGLVEGFDTHFELADIRHLTAEKILREVNKLKYGNIFRKGNIDAFFGGPPCQGFSRLGKRDASDPRNMLFHEYLRLIRDVKPKYVVMENVTGILDMYMLDFPNILSDSKYSGQHLVKDLLKAELEGLDYTLVDVQVLNAANFGVPQRRNRVVFLAYRNDVEPLNYPEPTNENVLVKDALGDLYSQRKYSTSFSKNSMAGRTLSYRTGKPLKCEKITNMELPHHDRAIQERFSLYGEGENNQAALSRLPSKGIDLFEKAPALFWECLFTLNREKVTSCLTRLLRNEGEVSHLNSIVKHISFVNKILAKIALAEFTYQASDYKILLEKLAKRLQINNENAELIWKKLRSELDLAKLKSEYTKKFQEGKIDERMSEALFTKKVFDQD